MVLRLRQIAISKANKAIATIYLNLLTNVLRKLFALSDTLILSARLIYPVVMLCGQNMSFASYHNNANLALVISKPRSKQRNPQSNQAQAELINRRFLRNLRVE